MVRLTIIIAALTMLLILPLAAYAKTSSFNYVISSYRQKIGSISVDETLENEQLQVESLTNMDFSSLEEDYIIVVRTEVVWNEDRLASFDHWIVEKKSVGI